jgi:hypothetical protein
VITIQNIHRITTLYTYYKPTKKFRVNFLDLKFFLNEYKILVSKLEGITLLGKTRHMFWDNMAIGWKSKMFNCSPDTSLNCILTEHHAIKAHWGVEV